MDTEKLLNRAENALTKIKEESVGLSIGELNYMLGAMVLVAKLQYSLLKRKFKDDEKFPTMAENTDTIAVQDPGSNVKTPF